MEESNLDSILDNINSICLNSYNYVNLKLKDYLELKNQGFFIWCKIKNNKIKIKTLIERCKDKNLYLHSHESFVDERESNNFNHIRIIPRYDSNEFKRGIDILKNIFKEMSY